MGFWNEIPPSLFDDMKPHEVTARELQTHLVDGYDFYRMKIYEILLNDDDDDEAELARMYGGAEAVGGIYLYFFGGKAMLGLEQMIEKKIEESE